ncbi:MAG: hypothetical protein II943_07840 [Victivallales bacterium]|nr:hypothetical protein [Victivallales bacterium]
MKPVEMLVYLVKNSSTRGDVAPVDGECRELLKAAGLTPAALAKRYLKTP